MDVDTSHIFAIDGPETFETCCLAVFNYQYQQNPVYHTYCKLLKKHPDNIKTSAGIPYLPIEFFKSKSVVTAKQKAKDPIIFTSSGTTGSTISRHIVADITIYERSFLRAFEHFYGPIAQYCVLALLPSYLDRQGSSLIYMANDFIHRSNHKESGFYLSNIEALKQQLVRLDNEGTKILLLGVSFALLDFAETYGLSLKNTIVMETGGMKGRRKEMIRSALHQGLCEGFGVEHIHSEYGMTELLSQAYSKGNGIFKCPPWMQVSTRDTEDPLTPQAVGKTGGLNIIDLANVHSCAFIATQDLGKTYADGSFEVLGRFDHSDVRGCNLMVL